MTYPLVDTSPLPRYNAVRTLGCQVNTLGEALRVNKIVPSVREAVADIFDGATVLVGGFGGCGDPFSLVNALVERGARNLTIVCTGPTEWGPFVEKGLARKIIAGFTYHPMRPEINQMVERLAREGKLEVETVPHGILEERVRAAGVGFPAFYSPVGIGTPLESGKEKRTIDGREYVLEHALKGDFALIKGHRGDRFGNITCRLSARNRTLTMAMGAEVTIAEVEEIVDVRDTDPERVDVPAAFVRRVVQAPRVEKWFITERD